MKLIPAFNCEFNLKKGGFLTIFATDEFTQRDAVRTFRMVKLHAKWKKVKKPVKWRLVPTLY
jgi:hypothetical protein